MDARLPTLWSNAPVQRRLRRRAAQLALHARAPHGSQAARGQLQGRSSSALPLPVIAHTNV